MSDDVLFPSPKVEYSLESFYELKKRIPTFYAYDPQFPFIVYFAKDAMLDEKVRVFCLCGGDIVKLEEDVSKCLVHYKDDVYGCVTKAFVGMCTSCRTVVGISVVEIPGLNKKLLTMQLYPHREFIPRILERVHVLSTIYPSIIAWKLALEEYIRKFFRKEVTLNLPPSRIEV